MFRAALARLNGWDMLPVEAYARHLGRFDVQEYAVPGDAAGDAAVEIDDNAEDYEGQYYTRQQQPPAYEEIGQGAEREAAEEDGDAGPAIAVAAAVKDGEPAAQAGYLSFDCL